MSRSTIKVNQSGHPVILEGSAIIGLFPLFTKIAAVHLPAATRATAKGLRTKFGTP